MEPSLIEPISVIKCTKQIHQSHHNHGLMDQANHNEIFGNVICVIIHSFWVLCYDTSNALLQLFCGICILSRQEHVDRASLITDHRISGLPIRAKFQYFRTICLHTFDNSPTVSNSPF